MASAAPATGSAAAADPGTSYKLLLSCPTGLPRSRFDQSFDRIPHPDAALEGSISEIWNQRLERNPSLYNGTKFRICITLSLGLIQYMLFGFKPNLAAEQHPPRYPDHNRARSPISLTSTILKHVPGHHSHQGALVRGSDTTSSVRGLMRGILLSYVVCSKK